MQGFTQKEKMRTKKQWNEGDGGGISRKPKHNRAALREAKRSF